jgi:hypothetical protein
MEELIKRVEQTKRVMEKTREKIDNFDYNIDMDDMDDKIRKIERRIINLRNELEVEDFLLQVEQQNENNI